MRPGGSRPDLTVDLSSLLPLAVVPGYITVGYTGKVATDARAQFYLGADLTFTDATGSDERIVANAVPLQVAFPDVFVATTGTDTYIPRGQDVGVLFGIGSTGQIDPPEVSLEIGTSPGFTLTTTPGRAINCHSIGVRRTYCRLPFSQPASDGELGIRADAGTRPGQTGDLVLITQPIGTPPDLHQANNIHHMPLHVRGIADLSVRWRTPAGGAIPVGQPVTVTAEITNNGPDPATGISGWIEPPKDTAGSAAFRVAPRSGTIPGRPVSVHIPRLAVHATYSVTLRVTGLKVGARGTLGMRFSYPEFPFQEGGYEPVMSVDPTNVEPTVTTLTVVASSPPASGASLPATGAA